MFHGFWKAKNFRKVDCFSVFGKVNVKEGSFSISPENRELSKKHEYLIQFSLNWLTKLLSSCYSFEISSVSENMKPGKIFQER